MKVIRPEQITDNPFKMIGKDTMLIAAEKDGNVNMMTASWGGVGVLWNKNVATIYIRPSRYTKEFLDAGTTFSLNFFSDKYKNVLEFCGTHSGRDCDKVTATKLKVEHYIDTPWFSEARTVLICRKLYAQTFDAFSFADQKMLDQNYRADDFHTMYIGEIERVMIDTRPQPKK